SHLPTQVTWQSQTGGDEAHGYLAHFLLGNASRPTKSLAGRAVLITGANTGLGLEGARYAARLGCARHSLAVCSPRKGGSDQMRHRAGDTDMKEEAAAAATAPPRPEQRPLPSSVGTFAARTAREMHRLESLRESAAGASSRVKYVVGDNERMVTVNMILTLLVAFPLLPKQGTMAVLSDAVNEDVKAPTRTTWLTSPKRRRARKHLSPAQREAKKFFAN
ncbi:short-chain dehydrogenase/reductase family protein, partial [Apiospora kogelbergensis]